MMPFRNEPYLDGFADYPIALDGSMPESGMAYVSGETVTIVIT